MQAVEDHVGGNNPTLAWTIGAEHLGVCVCVCVGVCMCVFESLPVNPLTTDDAF